MRRFLCFIAIIAALVIVSAVGSQAQTTDGTAFLRFVHVIPGVNGFDVYTDGQLTLSNLSYGEASNYINVPAGMHEITVRTQGLTTLLWQQQVEAVIGAPKTLIASTIDPLSFDIYEDDFLPAPLGTTRLWVIHAISGAPNIDVSYGGNPVGSGMAYRSVVGSFDLPADVYPLTANYTDGSGAIFTDTPFSLVSNTSHFLLLYGTPAIPDVLLLSAPLAGEPGNGSVRFAHSIASVSNIDFYANGGKIVPALAFGQMTEHIPLAEGTYTIEAQDSATATVLGQTTITVTGGGAQTVVIMGAADNATIGIFSDSFADVTADTAVISVLNTVGADSSISVALADGTSLADALAYNGSPIVTQIAPASQGVTFTPTIAGQSVMFDLGIQQFYGGVYYTILAIGGTTFSAPTLVIAGTSVNQGIASAPGAAAMVVAAPTEVPVVEQPPATTEMPAVATPQPTLPLVVVGEEELPTAQVAFLDPGANLHLRQFPRTDALSLALIPTGATLTVNGREGAPIDIDGNVLPIGQNTDGSPVYFADPAVNVDLTNPFDDLDKTITWLNVTYDTPDGGHITAWTIALYLDVRRPNGERQRLVLLPMIPNNQYGEAVDTAITPPPATENLVTAQVSYLDPGANLNMRRTPSTDGEILARLPGGTIIEFLGMGGSGEWAFALYAPAEGGYITGWVSPIYLAYKLNGENITFEHLQERGFVETIDEETTIGEISADAPGAIAPTPNPMRNAYVAEVRLNAGANLNLRRNPDAQAEVLVPIPSGSQLIIQGRTLDGLWLFTAFENQEGWIASTYVVITFNGNFVEIEEIPVIDTSIPATPTP